MGVLGRLTLWSFLIAAAGFLVGLVSGAVGVCGNGGWGSIPAYIGLGSWFCFLGTLPVWLFRGWRRLFYS